MVLFPARNSPIVHTMVRFRKIPAHTLIGCLVLYLVLAISVDGWSNEVSLALKPLKTDPPTSMTPT